MVRAGLAWHYVKYSKSKTLTKLEQEARDKKLGLWAATDKPIAPWEWRAMSKEERTLALSYANNQWQTLRRYTEDGRLSIDNNVIQRTLRHQAIGRKNWLFLGSAQAGPRAAVLSTILAGGKRHRIEPWAYLREILLRLHADDVRLDKMLPDRWAADHPKMVLSYRLDESRQKSARQRERQRRQLAERRPK